VRPSSKRKKGFLAFIDLLKDIVNMWNARISAYCRSYGVKEEELLASRSGRPNEARNVAIYLLRQLKGSKLKEIGTEFGISSYSTVSTIIKRTRNEIPKNRRLRKRIERLRSELVLSQETPFPPTFSVRDPTTEIDTSFSSNQFRSFALADTFLYKFAL